MNNQKKYSHEVNRVLEQIFRQNPQIVPARVELFSEVYYPIAILEIAMTETTFEDFEFVPLTVLNFIKSGMLEAREIANMMGLSSGYVQKIIDLLMGYGYVEITGITSLGREALITEKKIAHSTVRQRFQADAVTGDLLKIGIQPSETDLQGKEKTFGVIPHIPHIEGISIDYINSQLQNEDLTKYKQYQGDVLHANVEEIIGVECVGLEYIKAYLVKMQGIDSPFIISYKYDSSKETFQERYRWQPMRMPCEKAYKEYGFSRDIECYSEESLKVINELYKLVCKNIIEIDEKRLKKLLGHIHPFDYATMDISVGNISAGVPEQISIYLNANSLTKWNSFVLSFLSGYDPITGYLYTNSWLNGLFIRFESQNIEIKKVSKMYKRLLRHHKKSDVNSYIRTNLFEQEKELFVFSELEKVLLDFEKENEDYEEMNTRETKE